MLRVHIIWKVTWKYVHISVQHKFEISPKTNSNIHFSVSLCLQICIINILMLHACYLGSHCKQWKLHPNTEDTKRVIYLLQTLLCMFAMLAETFAVLITKVEKQKHPAEVVVAFYVIFVIHLWNMGNQGKTAWLVPWKKSEANCSNLTIQIKMEIFLVGHHHHLLQLHSPHLFQEDITSVPFSVEFLIQQENSGLREPLMIPITWESFWLRILSFQINA